MKKLMKMFKSLPPEARSMLALVGLASPIGAIYFLKRLFPGVSLLRLIIYVLLVIVGIAVIAFIISKIFGRGGRKRADRMAKDLASDATTGPAGMDVSAAIKANNEKFFTAIRGMRKEVGISVYDLPWYIVIGDSGCGKTFLVNNGGLTFSRGRPEGYQLGTLNYNWWFTEDAVFIDMAGRLCNPQEDADRREWDAFLGTIGKGRKGFPINGAILCVSAEHLLQDPPEKLEADANVALERLRDLQTKLGVTFATYLVVTKCDKILGFMQFFDRADRDITVKNQIFGWSRPGGFNELYDPEAFKADFEGVYGRLNDLRLRRLNDDVEEMELGLAYSFPEEFRELCDPLLTYVRTLFPMIKNPRAVKNLLFRGVYFTSATQEGELILKHLKARLGNEAADQFAPLDTLYPNKRPHFIKDVLFKKVFPENGLVFRNEQQVLRNRKLSKVLKLGTVLLAIVLFGMFALSLHKFEGLIGAPRAHAKTVAEEPAARTADQALGHAAQIRADVEKLQSNYWAARFLSLGVGTRRPIEHLNAIRAKLTEAAMIEALTEVDEALRSGAALQAGRGELAQAYLDALEQYVLWYGCMGRSEAPPEVSAEHFRTLCSVVSDPESVQTREGFFEQAQWYFSMVHRDEHLKGNPASLLEQASPDPADTILVAIDQAYRDHLLRYATFDENHPDENIAAWMRIRDRCAQVAESYEQMLGAAEDAAEIETREGLQAFKERFTTQFDIFDQALTDAANWGTTGAGTTLQDIPRLKRKIIQALATWRDYEERLRDAAAVCALADPDIQTAIASVSAGDKELPREGLDRALWRSLQTLEIVQIPYREGNYDEEILDKAVREVFQLYPDILVFTDGDSVVEPDRLELTTSAREVRARVSEIAERLAASSLEIPSDLSGETAEGWIEAIYDHLDALEAEEEAVAVADLPPFWRPEDLSLLYGEYRSLIQLGEGTILLKTIVTRLEQVGPWGFAELVPYDERAAEQPAPYSIPEPRRPGFGRGQPTESEKAEPDRPKRTRKSRRRARDAFGDAGRPEEEPQRPREIQPAVSRDTGRIPACATHTFLSSRAEELVDLLVGLAEMRDAFLYDEGDAGALNERCLVELEESGRTYMEAYVEAWNDSYTAKELTTLGRLGDRASDWGRLASQLAGQYGERGAGRYEVADEFESGLLWILRAVPWATYHPEYGMRWESASKPEWMEVSSWMDDAVSRAWNAREGGDFVFARQRHRGRTGSTEHPWQSIASEFREAWMEVAEAIGRNADLPTQFEEPWSSTAIPWNRVAELRAAYGLEDEDRLTGALVRFEEQAQRLLSTELTSVLCNTQRTYFKRDKPFDGWPYVGGQRYEPTGLKTVDFRKFKEFLVVMHRARAAFQDLEDQLPDDAPGRRERRAFYGACEGWFKFLDLSDDLRAEPVVLNVTIKGEDAIDPPFGQERVDETAQFAAKYFTLDLGLTLSEADRAGGDDVLRIATEYQYKIRQRKATWEWRSTGKELTVGLEEGLGNIAGSSKKILGRSSPLALCAYLHRYGRSYGDPKTWYVSHAFEQTEQVGAPGDAARRKKVGEKAVFMLGRGLPDPIPELVEIERSGRGDW